MEKKIIGVLSTDWHLKESNIESIKDLIIQKCELAKSLSTENLLCLGDVFDSRKSQTISVLNAFGDILDTIERYGLVLYVIPGNHDKSNYSSFESFLDPFAHHPAIRLIRGSFRMLGRVVMIPYFNDDMWVEEYSDIAKIDGQILLSHQAFTGSRNNDGSEVLSKISTTMFSNFNLVLFGHYHDQQQLAPNCYHIPSIQQNNYGENTDKGFTVLYDDFTFELVKSKFKEYKKVVVDLDKTSKKELDTLIKENSMSEDCHVRFELVGDESKIKSISKEIFVNNGIDLKTKIKEIEDNIQYEEEIKEYTVDSIFTEFELFCEEKGKDYKKGVSYLKEKLNGKNN